MNKQKVFHSPFSSNSKKSNSPKAQVGINHQIVNLDKR